MSLNYLTIYLAIAVSFPICFAYFRLASSASEIVRHMAISIFCIVSSYAGRALFWDAVPVWVGDDWAAVYSAVGGVSINVIWNVAFIYGCWRALKALHLMVPDTDRSNWPVWRAWLYPPWRRRRIVRKS